MNDLTTVMPNVDAAAFLLLAVATAASWFRSRDRSSGFLALAIVLLSLVIVLGRVPSLINYTPPLLSEVNLLAFTASAYALFRYRASLIRISRRWQALVLFSLAGILAGYLLATGLVAMGVLPKAVPPFLAFPFLLLWCAIVTEPIVRFWLVSRGLAAVQRWRLRALSAAFASIVAILLLAIALASAGATTASPGVLFAVQVAELVIVPLLFISFSPPAWLRREWRAGEEEGLRKYLEGLLVVDGGTAKLNEGALEWAARLTGGAAAASFDFRGEPRAAIGLDHEFLEDLRARLPNLPEGIVHFDRQGAVATTLIVLPIVNPEGNGRLVLVSGPFTPAFGSEEVVRVQQFMTAVTAGLDRKTLVTELQEANRQLQEASDHKSIFLANMSHELRTPLNAIIGFSELMLDAHDDQFDAATQKRFLGQIHNSGKHLLGLINDILDLSKVEAGQMELHTQLVPIAPIVSQVLSLVEPLAGQKHIQLTADVAATEEVMADPGKVKQMLLNLVSNGIKFTPEGGKVSITSRRLLAAIEIAVTDTGIGISLEDQKGIFREFHQVDPGPGRREQGTGLGLALTRRFALLHGGEVRVHSKVGEGSVFTLRLPLQAQVAAPVAVDGHLDKVPVDLSRPLVLVIEDDIAAGELMSRQLQAGGFRTEIARTGTEAIAKARTRRPAAITLDILLPELDGWEVITRLKRDEATSDIPVIIVTVVDNPDLGMALGALDYFVKPVDGKELVDRLSRFKFSPNGSGGFKVLVVDDEAANRTWLTRILEPAGFDVTLASGGREAIEMAKGHPPDLVLLDLMMPEVSGFDVVEALRADPTTERTPIMILTSRHLSDADKRHLNGSVSSVLTRGSVASADLVGLLRELVEKRAPVS